MGSCEPDALVQARSQAKARLTKMGALFLVCRLQEHTKVPDPSQAIEACRAVRPFPVRARLRIVGSVWGVVLAVQAREGRFTVIKCRVIPRVSPRASSTPRSVSQPASLGNCG